MSKSSYRLIFWSHKNSLVPTDQCELRCLVLRAKGGPTSCFGFILLESLVGASAYARREASLLKEMASFGSQDGRRLIDPIILGTCSQESLPVVISTMTKCISSESATHPSVEDVLWNLQYAAQIQATAD